MKSLFLLIRDLGNAFFSRFGLDRLSQRDEGAIDVVCFRASQRTARRSGGI